MNKSKLFKAAHELTRATVQAGDNYRVTFGACLRAVYARFIAEITPLVYQIIGRTYEWKKELKRAGLNWNASNKSWDGELGSDYYGELIKTEIEKSNGELKEDNATNRTIREVSQYGGYFGRNNSNPYI